MATLLTTLKRRPWLAVAGVMVLALALRVAPLVMGPPWMDETATAIFSLGNSSRTLPLNRLVDLEAFLAPLQGSGRFVADQVLQHLFAEDNHPPLFFLLAHGWLKLVQPDAGLANLGWHRLLPALLGVVAVLISAAVGRVALGSARGALLGALWMAISPLALAQSLEIRHYSLAIVLSTASLLCFTRAWRAHRAAQPLPWPWVITWVASNAAGVACHYFFVMGLLMQALAAAVLMRRNGRCWLALAASIGQAALWIPALRGFAGSGQSSWLQIDPSQPAALLAVPLQALLGVLFTAVAPGTYAVHPWQWPFAVAAGLATLIAVAVLLRAGRSSTEASRLFAVLVGCGLLVQIGLSLLLLSDFSKGFRYSFFLIPAAVGWLACRCDAWFAAPAAGLRRAALTLLLCALISAIGVDAGAVLPKWYSADLLTDRIARDSRHQVVLVYDHARVDTGPMVVGIEPLSVAWWIGQHPNLQRRLQNDGQPLQLMLAVDGPGLPGADRQNASAALNALAGPFDLWFIGAAPERLISAGCQLAERGSEGNHSFSHYRCASGIRS